MSNPSTPPARRERTSEDPWTVAYRVVHDLRRDGVTVDAASHRMPVAVRHAARLLEVLGVAATMPDEPALAHDAPGVAQPGGGWISGPSNPAPS
jgi:hypothetical protein